MPERCYCPETSARDRFTVEGDEAHHLSRVRRIAVGDRIEAFNGLGLAVVAQVTAVGKNSVTLEPAGPPLPDRTPRLSLTLATAVPKGERFDWLVEKAVELGVARLAPILTDRSVVDPRDAKLDRLRRLGIAAAKQSGRHRLMSIDPPRKWSDRLHEPSDTIPRFLAHPTGRFDRRVPTFLATASSAWLAVGPEGGFTEVEVEAAVATGWTPLDLGPTLLRIETAALVGVARLLAWSDRFLDGTHSEPERSDG